MSSSNGCRIWPESSASRTFFPARRRFSATSMPMNPPPTTNTSRTSGLSIHAFIAQMSRTLRMVNTFSPMQLRSGGGTMGFAPGERTSLS